ncbi:chemotaxis protein CheC [Neptunomonas sp.]|uniref:chemotaxis protein CheC n=1 Tax=Neptunomonas sp. TaxID=1971898 RepID=UPI00356330BB
MSDMSALELDALQEIFNVGVGRAAASLSQLTNETISMSVPVIHMLSPQGASEFLDPHHDRILTCISQTFSGSFSGNALLIFPSVNSLEIVRLMLGSEMPLEQLSEVEQDAMCEIGNIILNACFSTIGGMLSEHFCCQLPVLKAGYISDILNQTSPNKQVLIVQIQMGLEKHNIEGFLAFLLENQSAECLHQAIKQFLTKVEA